MATGTRGQQDLKNLKTLVGPSKSFPHSDLPSLRDILAAGMHIKEVSLASTKQHSIRDLCMELTDLLISLYSKANKEFLPGKNMMNRDTIINKVERDWRRALDIVNNKGKSVKQKKENMMLKLDKIYSVLFCQCPNIRSCMEEGCGKDCKKGAHIECSCLKEQKLPVIELLFIRDQRNRVKGGLGIGLPDHIETAKVNAKLKRKKQDEDIQTRKGEQQKTYEHEIRSVHVDSIEDGADENDNFIEENYNDLDFVAQLKMKSSQNRVDLTNLARESIRSGVSVRATASLATALLIDLKIVTKEDSHLIVDPTKVQRARTRVMDSEKCEALKEIEESKLECVFFDGRRDKTKVIVVDEDGDEFARTEFEEHYTLTDPHKYLTHVTPEEGTGAKGTAEKVIEFLEDVNQLENVKIIGGDSTNSNTGWKNGSIHLIEAAKKEKVLWDICLLHINELSLRHLMKDQGMETSGANSFTGELGDLVKDEVHLYEVNNNFEILDFGCELRELPEEVIADLSTDQKYLYQIVKMIITGELDHDVLKQVIGPVNHSRWLTTGNRLARSWVSKHSYRKNSRIYKSLKIIVSYIVSVYAVMWFDIKCKPNILHGPSHMLKTVQLVEKYCSAKVKEVVEPVIQRGGYHAHSENLLLSMLGSEDQDERKYAVEKITEIRGGEDYGDCSVRSFHVPQLNFEADSLSSLIDMSGKETPVLEPVLTCKVATGELDQYIDNPFPEPDAHCHTQACERAVKETTIAAGKVYGFAKRDGYIRAKMKSRKLVSEIRSKKALAGMLG